MLLHEVEQGSDAWFQLRLGIPTASEFSRLITSKGEISKSLSSYASELAAELFAGKQLDQFDGNVWMNRGKDMEAEAISLYEFATDQEVKRVGFITNDMRTAGYSPDGIVGDDGLIEVKCLKAERHIAAIQYYKKHASPQTDYIQQTQGGLFIAERKWCDLVFHHPDLPQLIIRQLPDHAIRIALSGAINDVIAERDEILKTMKYTQTHIPEAKAS